MNALNSHADRVAFTALANEKIQEVTDADIVDYINANSERALLSWVDAKAIGGGALSSASEQLCAAVHFAGNYIGSAVRADDGKYPPEVESMHEKLMEFLTAFRTVTIMRIAIARAKEEWHG